MPGDPFSSSRLPNRAESLPHTAVPQAAYGWVYELDYSDNVRRVRPATAAEREASDDTRYVNGAGIFALLEDSTILRSDVPNYPPASAFARYY
jgi:hypothetical protein